MEETCFGTDLMDSDSPRPRRAPQEFSPCRKNAMFSYAFMECVCGILETRCTSRWRNLSNSAYCKSLGEVED